MHITRIKAENLPPLEDVTFKCDERVNLFIGPNASGKSTILRAIREMYFSSGDYFAHNDVGVIIRVSDGQTLPPNEHLEFENSMAQPAVFDMRTSDDWPRDGNLTNWQSVPLKYVPATRVNMPRQHLLGLMDKEIELTRTVDSLGHWEIQYAQDVEVFIEQLRDTRISRTEQIEFRKALDRGYSCAKEICREMIYDDRHHWMNIGTSDNPMGEPLYAGNLSSGTQGTLMWVWDMVTTMLCWRDFKEDWESKPAILLIDEIENHLHPTWQRRVIPALLKHFPKLQIFATTHSPFVVAGLKAGQVHLLKRGEHGSVTASTNTEDVIGWTADEILRTMMDVDEPTDQLTVDRVNRLRQLREKDTLTSKEESELNGLRRQINKDLLAKGGPLEVEREHYADLMQEFLRNRQSELTQDTE